MADKATHKQNIKIDDLRVTEHKTPPDDTHVNVEALVGCHIVTDIHTLLIYHSTFPPQKSVKGYSKEHSNYTDKHSYIYQGGVSERQHRCPRFGEAPFDTKL